MKTTVVVKAADVYVINDQEREYVAGQIRQSLRKLDRGIRSLRRRFGSEADVAKQEERRRWLERFYEKLGGNVEKISNRSLDAVE